MATRFISGIIGVGLFLAVCFAGLIPFTIGVTLLAAIGLWEFVTSYRAYFASVPQAVPNTPGSAASAPRPIPPPSFPLMTIIAALGTGFPAFAYHETQTANEAKSYGLLLGVLVLLFASMLPRANATHAALGGLKRRYGIIALGYVGTLFSSFVLVRALPGRITVGMFPEADLGAWRMLHIAVCVWATDTFAYLVGRSIGKHKLAPYLSPNKTVEGSLGGFLGAVLVGALFAVWTNLPIQHGAALGMLAGVMGQLGDLFKSSLKREIGVKDFGAIMPGHGGILDRFDSLLFVAPLAYLYLTYLIKT